MEISFFKNKIQLNFNNSFKNFLILIIDHLSPHASYVITNFSLGGHSSYLQEDLKKELLTII